MQKSASNNDLLKLGSSRVILKCQWHSTI